MNRIEITNNWNLANVFNELEQGNMRIPRFQRSYVWEQSKIVKLLNSIYKEYPIGSFFLWETDSQMESFCRDITEFGFPSKPTAGRFTFILDGQQRITSLYVALKGKTLNGIDYRKICFNLDKRIFKIPTLKTETNNIPVWKIYDVTEYSKLLIEYSSSGSHENAMALMECQQRLTSYPVSIIKSKEMGLDEVVTIFERINQGGKRLSLFDLVHASVWSEDFDLRDQITAFNSEPALRLFGKVDQEIFTQSLALNIAGACVKTHQLALKNEECKAVWAKTTESIRLTIDFIKKQFGVQSINIIPYQNIIPILQYYFFKSGVKGIMPEHKQMISDWFWTVTFSNRYSSSTLTKMKDDAKWVSDIIEGSTKPRVYTVKLGLDDLKKIRMQNASVIKNGVLCLMALNSPVDFDNGDDVTLDNTNASRANAKENHHFFPFSLHSAFGLSQNDINSLLNFAFISKKLNLDILNKKPSVYLPLYEAGNSDIAKDLETHFINEAAFVAAKKDDFATFVDERGKEILALINNLCRVDDGTKTISANILDADDSVDDDDNETAAAEVEASSSPREPIQWLLPSNKKFFDLDGCIAKYGFVYWHQFYNFQAGDTMYIYSALPDGKITYKFLVEEAELKYSEEVAQGNEFNSEKYTPEYWETHNRYAKFNLVAKTESEELTLNDLCAHGLMSAPRGAICLSGELLEYIESKF